MNLEDYKKKIRPKLKYPLVIVKKGEKGCVPEGDLFETDILAKREDEMCQICKSTICLASNHRKKIGHFILGGSFSNEITESTHKFVKEEILGKP